MVLIFVGCLRFVSGFLKKRFQGLIFLSPLFPYANIYSYFVFQDIWLDSGGKSPPAKNNPTPLPTFRNTWLYTVLSKNLARDSSAEQCVPYISLDKSLIIKMLLPTYLHDSAKNRVVVHSAAIPSSVSELILALLNARLCTLSNELHMVLIQLAEFLLSLGKPC